MIHSVRFTAVLDTNVIYPIEIRDILLWFAHFDLFTPKWSKDIFTEWQRLMKSKGLNDDAINKKIEDLNNAFPDALVVNYEDIINCLDLKDQDDRHVVAAAIKTNANIIVTNNLKDFPQEYLRRFGLSAITADDFLTDIIYLNPGKATEAFRELVINRTNPDQDEFEVLDRFRGNGLKKTADYLHSQL